MNMLDEDATLRDLPCLILAVMLHAALLSAPVARWGAHGAPKASAQAIPVEFVASLPVVSPPAPIPPRSPALAREKKLSLKAPAKLKKAQHVSSKKTLPRVDQQAAARRRAAQAARRAESLRAHARKLATARLAAAERTRRAEIRREALARRRADASAQLASLPDPDEKLSDAVADFPQARGRKPAALPGASSAAAAIGEDSESLYDSEASAARRGGGQSWSLEGPVGSRRLLERMLPESPAWLSRRGLELSVRVKFQVEPDGTVKAGAVIKKTSGFPEIDQRALDALKLWRFDALPARAGGPGTWGIVTFKFLMG